MNKEELIEKTKGTLHRISDKIDGLQVEMEEDSTEAKTKYEQRIAMLQIKKEQLIEKYDELADIAEEKWDETKETFSNDMRSFKETLTKLFD